MRVDLHLHPRSSDGVLGAEEFASAIEEADVVIAVIANHDRSGQSALRLTA